MKEMKGGKEGERKGIREGRGGREKGGSGGGAGRERDLSRKSRIEGSIVSFLEAHYVVNHI